MTTTTVFAPTPLAPFVFQPTLDGQTYTVQITWSLFRQDWMLNIYTLSGQLVLTKALVGSPPDDDLNLVEFYFTTSTRVYRESSNTFEVSP